MPPTKSLSTSAALHPRFGSEDPWKKAAGRDSEVPGTRDLSYSFESRTPAIYVQLATRETLRPASSSQFLVFVRLPATGRRRIHSLIHAFRVRSRATPAECSYFYQPQRLLEPFSPASPSLTKITNAEYKGRVSLHLMAARVQVQNNMADYRSPMHQVPRKPVVGANHAGFQFQPGDTHSPLPRIPPNYDYGDYSHQRSRTTSSSALPAQQKPQHHHLHRPTQHPHPGSSVSTGAAVPTRRSSNATSSTNSTGGNPPTYTMSHSSSEIHRSSSSRSVGVPLGYVALMRRQKGTAWCDRAQPEDPRLLAQKRAAKQRAYLELHGHSARTGTLASGKIRHQSGKAGPTFSPSTLVGATVPVRLSANEIGDDDRDDHSSEGGAYHRRTGSGRSSVGSIQRYPSGYQRPGKTPPNEQANIPEVAESAPAADPKEHQVGGSLSSKNEEFSDDKEMEMENDFGGVGDMSAPPAADTALQKAKKAEDLRRRGSVDDRTTSLTGVRLFIANPDLDD